MNKRNKLFLLFSLATVLVFSAVLFADEAWYLLYDNAIKAIARQDWTSAEANLRLAMESSPPPGRSVQMKGRARGAYLPNYYLGVVYYNQGKSNLALEQFDVVIKSGILIPSDPELVQIARIKQSILGRPVQQSEYSQAAESHSNGSSGGLNPEERENRFIQYTVAMSRANRALTDHKFDQARTNVRDAKATGMDSKNFVEALSKQIDIDEAIFLFEIARKAKNLPEAARHFETLLSVNPGDVHLTEMQNWLDSATADLDSAEKERNALLAFLNGAYEESNRLLLEVEAHKKTSARVYFYLGCTAAALGFSKGEEEETKLIASAKEYFHRARGLDPAIRYNPRLISPRILKIYLETQ